MNREQFLLTKLAEECAEVAQMALKTQQFGMNESKPGQLATNKDRLHAELNDLNAIVQMLNDEFGFDYKPNDYDMDKKNG
jgi:NTP pyrophosphatase (non-canonical NTP hydrolase)